MSNHYKRLIAYLVVPALLALLILAYGVIKKWENQRKITQAEEAQSRPEDRVLPKIKKIHVSGNIEETIEYEITVDYSAQSDDKRCSSYNPFAGSSSGKIKTYKYQPTISEGKHSIDIPINKHKPNSGCQYQLKDISMTLYSSDEARTRLKSFTLFYSRGTVLNSAPYGFTFKQLPSNTINIECIPKSIEAGLDASYSPCGLSPIDKKLAISQQLSMVDSNYLVNLSYPTFDSYFKKPFLASEYYKKRVAFIKSRSNNLKPISNTVEDFKELYESLKTKNDKITQDLALKIEQMKKYEYSYGLREELTMLSREISHIKLLQRRLTYFDEIVSRRPHLLDKELDPVFHENAYYKMQINFSYRLYLHSRPDTKEKSPSHESQPNSLRDSLDITHESVSKRIHRIQSLMKKYADCTDCEEVFTNLFTTMSKEWHSLLKKDFVEIREIETQLLLNN